LFLVTDFAASWILFSKRSFSLIWVSITIWPVQSLKWGHARNAMTWRKRNRLSKPILLSFTDAKVIHCKICCRLWTKHFVRSNESVNEFHAEYNLKNKKKKNYLRFHGNVRLLLTKFTNSWLDIQWRNDRCVRKKSFVERGGLIR
jgi:hypothetical protein